MKDDQYDELDDLFSGGGAPAIVFSEIGDSVTGVISGMEMRQQRDFDTNELKVWDDGKPMMELIVTLDTDLRDDEIEDDEGERRVFCRGAMLTAFKQAVRKVKERKPAEGGRVTITYTDNGEVKRKGFNAPKLFTVEYLPPKAAAVEAEFDEPAEAPKSRSTAAKAKPAAKVEEPEVDTEDLAAQLAALSPAELAALLAK